MADGPARPVLLYDGDCRFCRFAARAIARLDRGGRFALLPFDDPAAAMWLDRVPPAEQRQSIHVVLSDGTVESSDAALAVVLERLTPLPRGASRALASLYGPVAARRDRLGPRVPDGEAPRRLP